MYTSMFNGVREKGEKEEEKERGREREREGPVVKKDFPTIYLHLRAINNSRVRACPRRTLEKKLCQRVGLLFRRPFKEDRMMRGKWRSFFTSSFLTFPSSIRVPEEFRFRVSGTREFATLDYGERKESYLNSKRKEKCLYIFIYVSIECKISC